METDILDKLASAVAGKIRPAVPIRVALWDSDDVSSYLRVSKNQLTRYTPRPDFPKPIRLPTQSGGYGHPLWKAEQVIKWAESYHDSVIKKRVRNG